MAAKSVNAFFEKLAESKGLQAKLKALHKKVTTESKEKAAAGVVKIAAAAGFKFTANDLAKARTAKVKARPKVAAVEGQWGCDGGFNYMCNAPYICPSTTWH